MNEIHRDNLIPGKLYFIECLTHKCSGEIIRNVNISMMVGIFNEYNVVNSVGGQWISTRFSWFPANQLLQVTDLSHIYAIPKIDVELNTLWRFYEIHRFKIQNAMESRALNEILKNVTGDEWFTYP